MCVMLWKGRTAMLIAMKLNYESINLYQYRPGGKLDCFSSLITPPPLISLSLLSITCAYILMLRRLDIILQHRKSCLSGTGLHLTNQVVAKLVLVLKRINLYSSMQFDLEYFSLIKNEKNDHQRPPA